MSFPVLSVSVLLIASVMSIARSAEAQAADTGQKSTASMSYDASKEVTLNGTVASVFPTAPSGMLAGSHLLLTTLSGSVDVSLGPCGSMGKNGLSVKPGQQIETTGVVQTFRGNPVLLARTVKSGDSLYAIRNEHGIPVTPRARLRASQSPQGGEKQ